MWRCTDKRILAVALGSEEDLRELGGGKPEEFVEYRADCVLTYSDQVPFYCKVRSIKQLYAESETRQKNKNQSPMSVQKEGPY